MARHACESVTAVDAIEKLVVDNPKVRLGLLDVWMFQIEDKVSIALGGVFYNFIDLCTAVPTYLRMSGRAKVNPDACDAQQLIDECPIKSHWISSVLGHQLMRLASNESTLFFIVDGTRVRVMDHNKEELFRFDASVVIEDGVLNRQALDEVIEKGLKNAKAHV